MKINNPFKSITTIYNKMSNFGKVLFFVALLLVLIVGFKTVEMPKREGYEQNDGFVFKQGNEIYDDFYSEIYDYLVFNNIKDDFEVGAILSETQPTTQSVILDVGCGTGHHVAKMAEKDLNVVGVDISPSMISQAKANYPNYDFKVGDVSNSSLFQQSYFTHILCLYFTIYYFKDKQRFFNNCMDWLMPGGFLVVHVVNREKFDPILPPGNPLIITSPQKYAKKRITNTKVTFNDFVYHSNFDLTPSNNVATFSEKFKFNNGKTRKQEHKLYMDSETDIIDMAKNAGFIVHGQIDLIKCAYENQFLIIFMKPE